MYVLDGTALHLDHEFSHGGLNYPANWLRVASAEDRAAIGITEVPDPVRPDDRFYNVSYDEKAFTYSKTPKDLNSLKAEWKQAAKRQAANALAPSDWMVIRSVEDGHPMPENWKKYRADVRLFSTELEGHIDSAKNIDVFINLVTNQTWPIDPDMQARIDAERVSTPKVG